MVEEVARICEDTEDWFGLYPKNRAKDPGFYVKSSLRHPAKMSLPLLRRIINEMVSRGELKVADTLVDPFGGRGATAVEWCRLHPLNWAITCELEAPYVDMAMECKALAETTLGRPMLWSIINGDSRKLDEHVSQIRAAISSPPYGKGVIGGCGEKAAERLRALTKDPTSSLYGRDCDGEWFHAMVNGYGATEGNIDLLPIECDYAAISSPPYAGVEVFSTSGSMGDGYKNGKRARDTYTDGRGVDGVERGHYGATEGQIGSLRDPDSDYAALGSPPYESSLAGDDPDKRGGLFRDPKRRNDPSLTANYLGNANVIASPPYDTMKVAPQGAGNQDFNKTYAAWKKDPTEENFAAFKEARKAMEKCGYGNVASIGSPPFEAQSGGHPISESGPLSDPALHARHAASKINKATGYADNTDGQIGTKHGESYGDACRDVYRALWRANCKHVTLVTKNPVKNQQLRRLDLLTVALMRDAGYELAWCKRAYLWQTTLQLRERGIDYPRPERPTCKTDEFFWDRWDDKPVGEMSFFNQLHLLAGRRPPAQFEDVLGFRRVD